MNSRIMGCDLYIYRADPVFENQRVLIFGKLITAHSSLEHVERLEHLEQVEHLERVEQSERQEKTFPLVPAKIGESRYLGTP